MLRASLLEGEFVPGEAISEPVLASRFNVSRGPVREALLLLSEEGLLTHIPNRGFFVLQLTDQDRVLIDAVRLPLEVLALIEARSRVQPEHIAELEQVRDKMLEAFLVKDMNTWSVKDQLFHSKIWELAANPWLVSAMKRIMVPYFAFSAAYKLKNPNLSYELMSERHNLYIEYLKGTTSWSAEECVRFHLGEDPIPNNCRASSEAIASE
jgi:DNA-binding GntR family transcriptional regulator